MERVIFHLDADAFFASIEQRDHPEWKGKPVIVGGDPSSRGVVSTCSYEARVYGVRSAQAVSLAYRLCPQAIFVKPRMSVYSEVSRSIFKILSFYTPYMETLSLDEAFMDMTGTQKLWGEPLDCAQRIQKQILDQLGLTVSIGIAPNKFLAKLASDFKKPFGITLTPFDPEKICIWLAPQPVGRLWGVGVATQKICSLHGIQTVADIQGRTLNELLEIFGSLGQRLFYLSRGIDSRPVENPAESKSISREHTFGKDTPDFKTWRTTLRYLAIKVAQEARLQGVYGQTLNIVYRNPTFDRHSLQMPLPLATATSRTLFTAAWHLLMQEFPKPRPIRLLGLGISALTHETQLDLWQHIEDKQEKAESTLDILQRKYGKNALFFGDQKRNT